MKYSQLLLQNFIFHPLFFCPRCYNFRNIQRNFVHLSKLHRQEVELNNMDSESCPKKLKLGEIQTIKEGKAELLVTNKNVFYNPVQEFNRDLSVAVLTLFGENKRNDFETHNGLDTRESKKNVNNEGKITVLEALSATGLRSVRYAKEVPGIHSIVANDISAKAVESIKNNIIHNGVEDLVMPYHEDALLLMYQNRKNRFDAIDLDPYGCPTIFLDGAVQCVSEGGLLLVTATDMAVLAGNSPETCYVKYGAISLKSKACHEIALRILLQSIAAHAGRYGRYIVPLLSVSVDFYIRVFVRVFTSQKRCKDNSSNTGLLYQCTGCETLNIQPLGIKTSSGSHKLPAAPAIDQLCKHCRHKHRVGGPIWLGSLHDQTFVSDLLCKLDSMELGTSKRIHGILSVITEELDIPLYYTLDRLMSLVKCYTPAMLMFRSALLNAGYKVSYSHANKISIKTNAPDDVIWDIVRAWEKKHPARRDKLPQDSPALAILSAPSTIDVSFDDHPLANPDSRQKHLSRFQVNPTSNWGPGTRSTTMINIDKGESKRTRNQNKKTRKGQTEAMDDNEDKNVVNACNDGQ